MASPHAIGLLAALALCACRDDSRLEPQDGAAIGETQRGPLPADAQRNDMKTSVTIDITSQLEGEYLRVDYRVTNQLDQAVLVFDRLYDMAASALAPDWCYVTIEGPLGKLRRQVEPLPRGLRFENPEVPYGRMLEPHKTAGGSFRLRVPLEEAGPFLHVTQPEPVRTRVRRVQMLLGWTSPPEPLPQPVQVEGQELYLLSHALAVGIQQIAASNELAVDLPAIARK